MPRRGRPHHLRATCAAIAALTVAAPATALADPAPPVPVPAGEAGRVQGHITGGQPSSRPYPFQASLRIATAQGTALCGASLIAARWVATAAHCITDGNGAVVAPGSVTAGIGREQVSLLTAAERYTGVRVVRHPAFTATRYALDSDVALIQLDRPAPQEQVRLPLPRDSALWRDGTTATIIGWGVTSFGGRDPQDRLREAEVPLRSDAQCAAALASVGAPASAFSPTTMVCAGGATGADSCQGDSGGPLLVPDRERFAIAGIVSFGYGCGGSLPAVYMRVAIDPLNAWIRTIVPQAEFEISDALPVEGQPVTFTAAARHPGPGAYGSLTWDLDSDGAFDDGAGPAVSGGLPAGRATVSLLATGADGDREIRRRSFDVRPGGRAAAAPVLGAAGSSAAQGTSAAPARGASARILSSRRRSDGAVVLRLAVTGPGRWSASVRGRSGHARGVLLGRAQGTTLRAGSVQVLVKLNARAKGGSKGPVAAELRFTGRGGATRVTRILLPRARLR